MVMVPGPVPVHPYPAVATFNVIRAVHIIRSVFYGDDHAGCCSGRPHHHRCTCAYKKDNAK